MGLMYKRNPALLLTDPQGVVLSVVLPRALSLSADDIVVLRRHAQELGLDLLLVESVSGDTRAEVEDEIACAARRRESIAAAPRDVRALQSAGTSYMCRLAIDLGILDGINDGHHRGEPFETLTPQAMAQRLRFRLAAHDKDFAADVARRRRQPAVRPPAAARSLPPRPDTSMKMGAATPEVGGRELSLAMEFANKITSSLQDTEAPCANVPAVSEAWRLRTRPQL